MSTDPESPAPAASEPPAPGTTPTPGPAGPPAPPAGADKKLVAGLLAILLNGLGIHKFYLGYQKEGLIMLLVTVLTCGFGGIVMGVIGIVEGIIYLTMSDEQFVATYITGRKGWF